MKKTILTYGLIAGAIVTAMMLTATVLYYNNPGMKSSEIVGFAGMLAAFAFVFIGIKNFRDQHNGGAITFGQGFKVGFLIALIASVVYVAVWLVEYYCFFPDFMEKYSAMQLNELKASGLNAAALQEKTNEIAKYKQWYKNPLLVILMTFMEVLPFGVIVALISALILKKKAA